MATESKKTEAVIISTTERMKRLSEIVIAYSHNVFLVDCVTDDVQWAIFQTELSPSQTH